MAVQHLHLTGHSEPCHYLPGREATTEYRIMTEVSPEEHELLLERGWRRFGAQYFRPVCAACEECVSLRLPVAGFRPSKSQRRAWRRCGHLRVETRAPLADETRLALYRRWHAEREASRGWSPAIADLQEYAQVFCLPHEGARELDYFDGDTLVAVGFIDETPRAVSSIYFFYDPTVAHLSLGVASVLFEVEWARTRGREFLFLGYRIAGCPSTAYKSAFGPHELLCGRPHLSEPPQWMAALPP